MWILLALACTIYLPSLDSRDSAEGTAGPTERSEGWARQEAKIDARQNLEAVCLKKKQVLDVPLICYDEKSAVCTHEVVNKVDYVTCSIVARGYCVDPPKE